VEFRICEKKKILWLCEKMEREGILRRRTLNKSGQSPTERHQEEWEIGKE
jgi:hypothetical protein